MRILIAIVVAMLVGVAPTSAAPDTPPTANKARAHYLQGTAYLKAGRHDEAIVEFEAAYAIDKKAVHHFNIGNAYKAKGDWAKAVIHYQRYVDEADEKTDKQQIITTRGVIVEVAKLRDEEIARKKAEEEAARLAAEQKRLEEEAAKKKIAVESRTKNAAAFASAGAWNDAGNELRAAFDLDGDVTHLLAAGEAYRKAPDLAKARDMFRLYLEKAPDASNAEVVRGKLAETTKAIEKQEADERDRKAKEAAERERLERERLERERNRGKTERPPHKSFKRGWIVVGGAMILTGLVADLKAPNADNGVFDVSDLTGPTLYGLGSLAILRGVF